ncbi:aspartate:alanine exchanger family transporter [Bdellovibrio sp. NC01]|uniref:aspartate:alanine exchanger family transporter n=1 Tax=Bdellovibrio sp. NC01 TaxID=2220073 RepID=UPI0011590D30|nr:TrkA C-terminal domain-containing protein [Bdellovibrio sp. NC01]QDK38550.1 transporter [Bdellovibrio sp. NC01]
MDFKLLIANHPEITIFFAILLGNFIGKIKIGHFSLGAVIGTLIAGLIVGIFVVPDIPEIVRWAFFDLFLFAIGYSVGPQFFSSLRRSALPQIIITVTVNLGGLFAAIACAYFFRFDTGTTAGVLSGALTQSAALGTGINAIHSLPISEDQKAVLTTNVPIADAMTYVFGDLGLILILVVILPALFKIDLKKESAALEESLKKDGIGGASESFFKTANKETVRAYVVTNPKYIGRPISEIEHEFKDNRMFIEKVSRDGKVQEVDTNFVLQKSDLVTVTGWRSGFIHGVEAIGPEVDSHQMLTVETQERKVFITNKEYDGMKMSQLAERGRGLYLRKITRGGVELPIGANLELHRGDVLYLIGAPKDLNVATSKLGFAESDPKKSDLAFIGACICIGIILGMFSLQVHDIPLGLGASGSVLVVGLIAGWAQKRVPYIGSIPESAQQILIDIGLIVFIAVVGLKAGPHAVDAIKEGGYPMVLKILGAGAITTVVGPFLGFFVGRFLLKQNAATTLATIGGAQTAMPSLNAIQDASGSKVLATSFTLPYAIGNILLTLWGPVIVAVSRLWQ